MIYVWVHTYSWFDLDFIVYLIHFIFPLYRKTWSKGPEIHMKESNGKIGAEIANDEAEKEIDQDKMNKRYLHYYIL